MHTNDLLWLHQLTREVNQRIATISRNNDMSNTRKANLLIISAKCGETLARYLLSINIDQIIKP